jgi:predicted MFS family arabinose efflux permease
MTTTSLHDSRTGWLLPFGVTLVAMFSLQLSNLGFSPLLPSIQADVGMTFTQLGFFTGLYGLLAMLLSVPAGLTAKRFGEKRVLAAGLVGVAIGSVLLGRAWNFESAVAFRGVTILGYRFAFVSVLIAVALTAPPSLRGRTMGVLGATSAMASVVGAPLGGALVDEFGWRSAILGYALMAMLGATVFWLFYRLTVEPDTAAGAVEVAAPRSAFRSPVVWLLALVVGLGGFGQFTITYFVPSVAKSVYGLDASAAGVIIATGYVAAIVLNLVIGVLADRFDKIVVLGGIVAILAAASASLAIEHWLLFRVATAVIIGFGFSAANQLYGLAGHLMPRREAGNAMGIVSLGAGLFGYFWPQMVGILRDATGSFAAGFYMVAAADLMTLGLIVLLYRMTRRSN